MINIRCCCDPRLCLGSMNQVPRKRGSYFLPALEKSPRVSMRHEGYAAPVPRQHELRVDECWGTRPSVKELAIKSDHRPMEFFEQLPGYQAICLLPGTNL